LPAPARNTYAAGAAVLIARSTHAVLTGANMEPVSFLLNLLVIVLVIWLVWWVMSLIPVPAQVRMILLAIFVVICVIWLLRFMWWPHAGPVIVAP
jgi:uncharacterized membrane protein YedE/YeeE